jgi:hypothetical protein
MKQGRAARCIQLDTRVQSRSGCLCCFNRRIRENRGTRNIQMLADPAKLLVSQLGNKFQTSSGARRFIPVSTRARHRTLPPAAQMRPVHALFLQTHPLLVRHFTMLSAARIHGVLERNEQLESSRKGAAMIAQLCVVTDAKAADIQPEIRILHMPNTPLLLLN